MKALTLLHVLSCTTLLWSCAPDESICDQAVDHAQECGLSVEAPPVCDSAAAAAAAAVLDATCPAPDGKADGDTTFGAWDDFQCTLATKLDDGVLDDVGNPDHCACANWSGGPITRDYDDGTHIMGRVLDADTRQPVQLAAGQWLVIKTANLEFKRDIQLNGVRPDAQGNFVLSNLQCDNFDLRVYVVDATTVPAKTWRGDWEQSGKYPLAQTVEGLKLTPRENFPLYQITGSAPQFTVLVTPGVLRH